VRKQRGQVLQIDILIAIEIGGRVHTGFRRAFGTATKCVPSSRLIQPTFSPQTKPANRQTPSTLSIRARIRRARERATREVDPADVLSPRQPG
jgi:hypothetical protein